MAEAKPQESGDTETRSPEELEKDIEEAREDLADTVAAVADKADVKKQAKQKVANTKQRATARVADAKRHAQARKDEFAAKAGEASPDSAGDVARQAQQYAERAQSYARENPMQTTVAGALLAGFAVGWLVGRR
jgi:ElaB/YqjD/DUF883 family membrane-anchored ribosome-binding protein